MSIVKVTKGEVVLAPTCLLPSCVNEPRPGLKTCSEECHREHAKLTMHLRLLREDEASLRRIARLLDAEQACMAPRQRAIVRYKDEIVILKAKIAAQRELLEAEGLELTS